MSWKLGEWRWRQEALLLECTLGRPIGIGGLQRRVRVEELKTAVGMMDEQDHADHADVNGKHSRASDLKVLHPNLTRHQCAIPPYSLAQNTVPPIATGRKPPLILLQPRPLSVPPTFLQRLLVDTSCDTCDCSLQEASVRPADVDNSLPKTSQRLEELHPAPRSVEEAQACHNDPAAGFEIEFFAGSKLLCLTSKTTSSDSNHTSFSASSISLSDFPQPPHNLGLISSEPYAFSSDASVQLETPTAANGFMAGVSQDLVAHNQRIDSPLLHLPNNNEGAVGHHIRPFDDSEALKTSINHSREQRMSDYIRLRRRNRVVADKPRTETSQEGAELPVGIAVSSEEDLQHHLEHDRLQLHPGCAVPVSDASLIQLLPLPAGQPSNEVIRSDSHFSSTTRDGGTDSLLALDDSIRMPNTNEDQLQQPTPLLVRQHQPLRVHQSSRALALSPILSIHNDKAVHPQAGRFEKVIGDIDHFLAGSNWHRSAPAEESRVDHGLQGSRKELTAHASLDFTQPQTIFQTNGDTPSFCGSDNEPSQMPLHFSNGQAQSRTSPVSLEAGPKAKHTISTDNGTANNPDGATFMGREEDDGSEWKTTQGSISYVQSGEQRAFASESTDQALTNPSRGGSWSFNETRSSVGRLKRVPAVRKRLNMWESWQHQQNDTVGSTRREAVSQEDSGTGGRLSNLRQTFETPATALNVTREVQPLPSAVQTPFNRPPTPLDFSRHDPFVSRPSATSYTPPRVFDKDKDSDSDVSMSSDDDLPVEYLQARIRKQQATAVAELSDLGSNASKMTTDGSYVGNMHYSDDASSERSLIREHGVNLPTHVDTYKKHWVIGPKANITGSLNGTGMREAGSSQADYSDTPSTGKGKGRADAYTVLVWGLPKIGRFYQSLAQQTEMTRDTGVRLADGKSIGLPKSLERRPWQIAANSTFDINPLVRTKMTLPQNLDQVERRLVLSEDDWNRIKSPCPLFPLQDGHLRLAFEGTDIARASRGGFEADGQRFESMYCPTHGRHEFSHVPTLRRQPVRYDAERERVQRYYGRQLLRIGVCVPVAGWVLLLEMSRNSDQARAALVLWSKEEATEFNEEEIGAAGQLLWWILVACMGIFVGGLAATMWTLIH